MACNVLKNAGFVPSEVVLRKESVSLHELLCRLEEGEERRTVLREPGYKLMKYGMMRRCPVNLDESPEYREKIVERFGGGAP